MAEEESPQGHCGSHINPPPPAPPPSALQSQVLNPGPRACQVGAPLLSYIHSAWFLKTASIQVAQAGLTLAACCLLASTSGALRLQACAAIASFLMLILNDGPQKTKP